MRTGLYYLILTILAGAFTIYLFFTVSALVRYYSLDAQTDVQEMEWEVVHVRRGYYGYRVAYTYNDGYSGVTILSSPLFRNPEAARKAMETEKKEKRPVWISSKYPEISTLQKSFPLKKCLYTALLFALFLYFIGFGVYVRNRL